MNFLSKIKKNIGYFFLALPLLLIGYETFMSLGLGSRTWSFLLIGQVAIVPLLAYIFYFIYNDLGGQTIGMSLLYFILGLIPIIIGIVALTSPSALGITGFNLPSISIPPITPPTQQQLDDSFAIFGKVAIPIIVILSIALLVFPEQFVGLFSSLKSNVGGSIVNAIKYPFESFFKMFENNDPVIGSDRCSVLPNLYDNLSKVPSFYLAHIAFFIGYVLTNALSLYYTPQGSSDAKQYNAQRSRTLVTLVTLSLAYIFLVYFRSSSTNCESTLGVFFTSSVFLSIGLGWYKLAEYCGCRASDLTGISTSIVSQKAKAPVVCLNPTTRTP